MKESEKKTVIVVGGGTAGVVVANNLSRCFNVTILERGGKQTLPYRYRIPLLIGLLYGTKNPFIRKVGYEGVDGRSTPFFEATLFGGASAMNGAVHVLGQTSPWSNLAQRFGFSFSDISAASLRLFSSERKRKTIYIRRAVTGAIEKGFFDACSRMGYNVIESDNLDRVGFGTVLNTVGRFLRSNVIDLVNPKNFKLEGNIDVSRLILRGRTVIGVEDSGGRRYFADVVILCAGVVESNAIVLRTLALVDDRHIRNEYRSAGTEIRDHVNLRINVRASCPVGSLNEIYRSWGRKIALGACYLFGVPTVLSGTGATGTLHFSSSGESLPDVRINFLRFYESGRLGSDGGLLEQTSPGFSFSITPFKPLSTGSIVMGPSGVTVKLGHLSRSEDLRPIRAAVSEVLSILKTPPMSKFVRSIEDVSSIKNDLDNYVRLNAYSGYHLIGGLHKLVKPDFSLIGINGAYVCDASVMGEHVSSNIHAAVVVLADLFSRRFCAELK